MIEDKICVKKFIKLKQQNEENLKEKNPHKELMKNSTIESPSVIKAILCTYDNNCYFIVIVMIIWLMINNFLIDGISRYNAILDN